MLPISSNRPENVRVIPVDPRKKIDFVFRALKLIILKESVLTSQIPFSIINHIAHNCLAEFIKYTMDILYPNQYEDEGRHLTTSCPNTFCSLSTLFVGIDKTKEVIHLLNIKPTFTFNIQLPSGSFYSFKTFDLFAGNTTQAISQDQEYTSLSLINQAKRVGDCALPQLIKFNLTVQQFVNNHFSHRRFPDKEVKNAINTYLKKSNFMFNQTIIRSLRQAISENSKKVTPQKSFVYFIKTKLPIIKDNKIRPIVEHAFVLEQFVSPQNGKTLVRPYQSWIDTATLLDEILKRKFNEMGGGSWNEKETDIFFDRFEDYLCSNTGYLELEKRNTCFDCRTSSEKKRPLVMSHENYFTGINVRYIIQEFDPAQCLTHLQDIVNHE